MPEKKGVSCSRKRYQCLISCQGGVWSAIRATITGFPPESPGGDRLLEDVVHRVPAGSRSAIGRVIETIHHCIVQRPVYGEHAVVGMTDVIDRQLPASEVRHGRNPAAAAHQLFLLFHIAVNHALEYLPPGNRAQQNRVDKHLGQMPVESALDVAQLFPALFGESVRQIGPHDAHPVADDPVEHPADHRREPAIKQPAGKPPGHPTDPPQQPILYPLARRHLTCF